MFVRVKDNTTGHEFDVPETDWRIGGPFSLVRKPAYPPSPLVRPAKHNVGPLPGAAKTKPSQKTTEKEAHRG